MYDKEHGLYIAHCSNGALSIIGKMANRHGLIAGATGTGKTVTLQVMAESFCQAGVPCFMADMKGDLSGISQVGKMSGFIEKRLPEFFPVENAGEGDDAPRSTFDPNSFQSCPVRFYDVYGEQGHPMRATVSQMGPQLLSRLLQLNETQDGVLNIVFRVADERGLMILDLKDLRSMLDYVSQHAKEYSAKYGNVSAASVGAIQRALLQLEAQGADKFFGEPSFDIYDLMQTEGGKGVMNVLAADKLMMQPKLYSTFLLWLLSELYSTLPEVGDLPLPKLVFFFDEAHLLFNDAPKALLEKIEQMVKLIRSKGVGVYFCTQNPRDVPDGVLAQLNNKIQHGLRAYTPADQKAVRAAADAFRVNPDFDTYETILALGTGEAVISTLGEDGIPCVAQKCFVLPPKSTFGTITDAERDQAVKGSLMYSKYAQMVDNQSAYEDLAKKVEEEAAAAAAAKEEAAAAAAAEKERIAAEKAKEKEAAAAAKADEREKEKEERQRKQAMKSVGNSLAGTVGRQVGKTLGGTFGTFGKTLGGNVGASLGRGLLGTLFKNK